MDRIKKVSTKLMHQIKKVSAKSMDQIKNVSAKLMDQISKLRAKLMAQIKIKTFKKSFLNWKNQTKKTLLLKNRANTYFLQTIASRRR